MIHGQTKTAAIVKQIRPHCPQCGARFIFASSVGGAVLHVGNEWRGAPHVVERFLAERAN